MIKNDVIITTTRTTSKSGFSPWWIISPMFIFLILMILGSLAYKIKKRYNLEKRTDNENNQENVETDGIEANQNTKENSKICDYMKASKTQSTPINIQRQYLMRNEPKQMRLITFAARGK